MKLLQLKYLLVVGFILVNLFGINKMLGIQQLLNLYLIVAVAPLIALFFIRRGLVNLLLLWFFLVIFKELGQLRLPLLPDIFPYRLVWILIFAILLLELIYQKRDKLLPVTDIEIRTLAKVLNVSAAWLLEEA